MAGLSVAETSCRVAGAVGLIGFFGFRDMVMLLVGCTCMHLKWGEEIGLGY